MKINSGSPIANPAFRPARADGSSVSGAFSSYLKGPEKSAPASGAAPVGATNVFAALEAVDGQERRRRAMRRGNRLLDLLDELRAGLLSGGFAPGLLADLARTVAEARGEVEDPALLALLDEIDLRAQVELAKHARMPA